MKDQSEIPDATASTGNIGSTLACLIAGLGIGAAVAILFAPKSGAQARQWIANKCLDGVDAANTSVRHTRRQAKVVIDQGQKNISEAVEAARELIGNS